MQDSSAETDPGRGVLLTVRIPAFLAGDARRGGAGATSPARRTVLDYARARIAQWHAAGCGPVSPTARYWSLCPHCFNSIAAPSTVATCVSVPAEQVAALREAAEAAGSDVASVVRSILWDVPSEQLADLAEQASAAEQATAAA